MSLRLNCDFGVECAILLAPMPLFSIIIAVYNDWTALEGCLNSLSQHTDGADFEVIAVDDGSNEPTPERIRERERGLAFSVVRQAHEGISAARNRGVEHASGTILLFVDADCRLQPGCLTALASAIKASPQHDYFQLRLIGDCSNLMGKTEHLRLTTLQTHTLQADGRIRYLNTAGFAVRRSRVEMERGLFNPAAVRAEDTLLLAELMGRGELPLFVGDAVVQHEIPLSVFGCLRKDIRSAFLEGRTYALIAARGIEIRMSYRERLRALLSMWKSSRAPSIGRMALLVSILRQSLSRTTSMVYRVIRGRSDLQVKESSVEIRP